MLLIFVGGVPLKPVKTITDQEVVYFLLYSSR